MIPSIASNQWSTIDDDPSRDVGMLMPPFSDERLDYKFVILTASGQTFGPLTKVDPFSSYEASTANVQFRVTISRQSAPYRPALVQFHSIYVS